MDGAHRRGEVNEYCCGPDCVELALAFLLQDSSKLYERMKSFRFSLRSVSFELAGL